MAIKSKATYDEIKNYGQERSGLKVIRIYISQEKQQSAIIKHKNYNHPKSKGHKQQPDAQWVRQSKDGSPEMLQNI